MTAKRVDSARIVWYSATVIANRSAHSRCPHSQVNSTASPLVSTSLTLKGYQQVRSGPRRYITIPGHETREAA